MQTIKVAKRRGYGLALIALSLLHLLATGAARAQGVVVEPGEPIILGALTARNGAFFGFGHTSERGLLLAKENQGELRIGAAEFVIEIQHADSACDAEVASAAARALVEENRAIGVIGPNCSTACLAVAPIFDAAGFTSLSPSCTAPVLTQQKFHSFHRLVNSDALIAEHGARFLYEELGGRRLILLFTADSNREYYEGITQVVADHFRQLGGAVLQTVALAAETDHEALAREIMAHSPDLLYCACTSEAGAAFLEARATSGLRGIPLLGAERDWLYEVVDLVGDAAEGVYTLFGEPKQSTASAELEARFRLRFNRAPHSTYYNNAYDAYHILLAAVAAVGELDERGALHIDRAALNAAIRNTSDYPGVTGTITCDARGECLRSPSRIAQVKEGIPVDHFVYED